VVVALTWGELLLLAGLVLIIVGFVVRWVVWVLAVILIFVGLYVLATGQF
jgi:hypothetical protein